MFLYGKYLGSYVRDLNSSHVYLCCLPFLVILCSGPVVRKIPDKTVGIATPASPPPAAWSTVQFSLLGARHPLSPENSGHHWPVWLIPAKPSIDFLQAIIAYWVQHITKAKSITSQQDTRFAGSQKARCAREVSRELYNSGASEGADKCLGWKVTGSLRMETLQLVLRWALSQRLRQNSE